MIREEVMSSKLTLLLRERETARNALSEGREKLAALLEREQSMKSDLLVYDKKIEAAKALWDSAAVKYLLEEVTASALEKAKADYAAVSQARQNLLDMMQILNRTKAELTESGLLTLLENYDSAGRKVLQYAFDRTREALDVAYAMKTIAECWALCPEASGIGDYGDLLKALFPQPATGEIRAIRADLERSYGLCDEADD